MKKHQTPDDESVTPYDEVLKEKYRRNEHKRKRKKDDRNRYEKRLRSPQSRPRDRQVVYMPLQDWSGDRQEE